MQARDFHVNALISADDGRCEKRPVLGPIINRHWIFEIFSMFRRLSVHALYQFESIERRLVTHSN